MQGTRVLAGIDSTGTLRYSILPPGVTAYPAGSIHVAWNIGDDQGVATFYVRERAEWFIERVGYQNGHAEVLEAK